MIRHILLTDESVKRIKGAVSLTVASNNCLLDNFVKEVS